MREKRKYNKFPMPELFVTVELVKEEGGLNLTDTIKKNFSQLNMLFDQYKNSSALGVELKSCNSFDEYFQDVVDKINSKEISGLLLQEQTHSYIWRKGSEITPFWLSCVYTELAKKTEQDGETSKGWSLAAHSRYYAGLSEAFLKNDLFKIEFSEQHKKSRKASNARDRNFEPVKREAILLLDKLAPKGGWKTKKSAIEGIEDKLHDYIKANGVKLALSKNKDSVALAEWLEKWINNDLAMKDALDANMIKKIPRTRCTSNKNSSN